MGWVIGIFIIVIVFTIITNSKSNNATKQVLEHRGYDMSSFLHPSKYLHGHPNLNEIVNVTQIYLQNDRIELFKWKEDGMAIDPNCIATILFENISNISLEDKSSIQTRVGLKRLMLTGVFAFALKKNEKIELNYLVIEWDNQGFKNETVFEYEGKYVAPEANKARNIIQNKLIDFRKEYPNKPSETLISKDRYEQLKEINNLLKEGILTQAEFDSEKKRILNT